MVFDTNCKLHPYPAIQLCSNPAAGRQITLRISSLYSELQIWMERIGGIEKTTRLPSDCFKNVIHIPEEQFHLGSILLLVLSAAAAFTVPDFLSY